MKRLPPLLLLQLLRLTIVILKMMPAADTRSTKYNLISLLPAISTTPSTTVFTTVDNCTAMPAADTQLLLLALPGNPSIF